MTRKDYERAKKDYERAATLVQRIRLGVTEAERAAVIDAFCMFFTGDNLGFDEARFRAACVPGANVKARPHGCTHFVEARELTGDPLVSKCVSCGRERRIG